MLEVLEPAEVGDDRLRCGRSGKPYPSLLYALATLFRYGVGALSAMASPASAVRGTRHGSQRKVAPLDCTPQTTLPLAAEMFCNVPGRLAQSGP